MSLRTDWNAIAARIEGLLQASELYLLSATVNSKDAHGTAQKALGPEAISIRTEIETFLGRYASHLPPEAAEAIRHFATEGQPYFQEGLSGHDGVRTVAVRLASVRGAVDYHLRDTSAHAKRVTERAFLHLQRSIVADSSIQSKWGEAFSAGEVACEKLGAAHLLQHGIWAFKSHAEGERTDLILGEPITDAEQIEATSEALVLTEWKKIDSGKEATKVAEAARAQCANYASGSLGTIELASYRYIVLVSEKRIEDLTDHIDGEVVYRYVNIPVDPQPPSRPSEKVE